MVPLIILLLALVLVVFPLWAIVRIISLGSQNADLEGQLSRIESELAQLHERLATLSKPAAAAPPTTTVDPRETAAARSAPPLPEIAAPPPAPTVSEVLAPILPPAPVSPISAPLISPEPLASIAPLPPPISTVRYAAEPPALATAEAPGETPPVAPRESISQLAATFMANVNWEQFMGANLFAWFGGFAAFLGLGFFVKYSFEHGWISPELRAALGFLFALSLVIGGLKLNRQRYAITAQTLIATGIVSLYAVTFACNAIYKFDVFQQHALLPFSLMALITLTAFLLAVRLDAQVVAVLGIVGGFLTPVLLSTGQDNPVGLFGYLALLDVGLIAIALHQRWNYLITLGVVGTVVMQIGWAEKFFDRNPDEQARVAVVVCLAFSALFLGATAFARRRGRSSELLTWSAAALPCACFGFALFFLGYRSVGADVGLFFFFAAVADLCLLTLAWPERQRLLVGIAAAGSGLLQLAWAAEILSAERAPAAMAMCLGFCALFLIAYLVARKLNRLSLEITLSAIALPMVAFVLAAACLGYPGIAARPGLLFSFVFLADGCLLVLAWLDRSLPKLHLVAGIVVFALLAAWTGGRLMSELLAWALAFYLLHAVLHTAFPLLLQRHRPDAAPVWWSQVFPPLTLLLMLGPLFKLDAVSLLFWPCVLLVDVIAIALALVTASLAAVAVVLLLTVGATGLWIFRVPATLAAEPGLLLVVGVFAALFFAASLFLVRRLGDRFTSQAESIENIFGDARTQIPACSALLPFILLIMMTQRLPLANPSSIFGLALLLVALTLGLAQIFALAWLPACALGGLAGLEYAWHARHFAADAAAVPLAWYLVFAAVFAIYPFIFRRRFAGMTGPWAVAALAGVVQFPLVYRIIQHTWPNHVLGLLPALFALPPLASLVVILRASREDESARLNQLAWFGGVALFFITLIFPIQFERQWLTVGWALEGAALLWLFHRVPHPGLRAVGVVLLLTAFARLSLNPAVLHYHARSNAALLNWYLYTYGIVTASLFVGARLVAPPRDRVLGSNAPALLNTLGTVLAFLLVNIEIADFFSTPDQSVLTFQFSGNFARDMTYTIAWALFALGLLLISIMRRMRAGRYAAMTLLGVALLKLFFHDLARLEALYRVGALFGVAIIAIMASFAYQHFMPGTEKNAPQKP